MTVAKERYSFNSEIKSEKFMPLPKILIFAKESFNWVCEILLQAMQMNHLECIVSTA